MIDFAAEKGNPGALLLKTRVDFFKQTSLDLKGEKNEEGVKPGMSREELTQLCYLLHHNLVPAESLILSCKFFPPLFNHCKLFAVSDRDRAQQSTTLIVNAQNLLQMHLKQTQFSKFFILKVCIQHRFITTNT